MKNLLLLERMWFFELKWFLWRDRRKTINITFRGDERKVYRYDRMAMLVEREDMQFFLIPTMEAERDSDQEENSDR